MREVVILANGEYPKNDTPLKILTTSSSVICCDGAINNIKKKNLNIVSIVGDLDSINEINKIKYKNVLYKIEDQETNDLTKSVNWAISKGYNKIIVLGASGKREDHLIGNIFLLSDYIHRVEIQMVTDYGTFTPIKQSTEFKSFKGQQVSLFSLNKDTKLTTHNLKYPINNTPLTNLWGSTLNESTGNIFSINFTKGEVIIFQEF